MVADMNKGLTQEELAFIQNQELPLPADIFLQTLKEPNYAKQILAKSGKINKDFIRSEKSQLKHKYAERIDIIKRIQTNNSYFRGRRKNVESWSGYLYTKKRNAYKINPQTGVYGSLNIDVPKLYGQLKLIAHKDGRKVNKKK